MGKLNILYHKSYHVYNRDNVERVKRDELRAEMEAEAQNQSTIAANSEARLTLLRHQKQQLQQEGSRQKERRLERALADQLAGKRAPPGSGDAPIPSMSTDTGAGPSRPCHTASADTAAIVDPTSGHLNFWAGLEHQTQTKVFGTAGLEPNAAYVRDKKKADEKWDELVTMRLDRPAHELRPWYSQPDLTNGEQKKMSAGKVRERASKDEDLKRRHDPLRLVKSNLYRTSSSTGPSNARKRKERQASRSHSPELDASGAKSDDDDMPALPPPAAARPSSVEAAPRVLRVDSTAERLKAQALLARHRAERQPARSQTQTPTRGYSDVYNRDEINAIRRESKHRRQRASDSQLDARKRTRYWE